MTRKSTGADLVIGALHAAGLRTAFTLSGNHIMPIFDAAIGSDVRLIHVRHEAAAVHMADAWGRLTGECGVALVSGGAGHANAIAGLCTAQAAESPVLLLSGHIANEEVGRGAFQELRQAEMAAPVTKAAWVVQSMNDLGPDIARGWRVARSGRPGPVHLSLPYDLLTQAAEAHAVRPDKSAFDPPLQCLESGKAEAILAALSAAARPLILAGPVLCHRGPSEILGRLAEATGVPAIGMESPRGINDPQLGAFAEVLSRADLLLLLGKPHDFTIRFADPPFVDAACRFIVVDADDLQIARVEKEKGERVLLSAIADADQAANGLIERTALRPGNSIRSWRKEVDDALAYRPPEWPTLRGAAGKVHPFELCQAVVPILERHPRAVLICDGGEIGQWPQSVLKPSRRIINGVAGSIGSSIPFAVAARAVEPDAPIIAIMGDGTFGFHMAEFDTAVRYGLPFVAIVGNDATWNAEYQIQVREYGSERARGCELLPARYDLIVSALGGHGELVTAASDVGPALERAIASNKPACVNVMIERLPAPIVRRHTKA